MPLTLKVYDVINGILRLEFTNLTAEQVENNSIDFEFSVLVNDEWHSIMFNEFKLLLKFPFPPTIFIRFAVQLKDYDIKFKMRYKRYQSERWSKYSDVCTVSIPSLITSTFAVNEAITYRQQSDFYLNEGTIVKVLEDDKFLVIPQQYIHRRDADEDNMEEISICLHKSRILGTKIYLNCILDIDKYVHNPWSNFLLLRSMDTTLQSTFVELTDVYTQYAKEYVSDTEESYNLYYIGRYIAKLVAEYASDGHTEEDRFMINCLVNSADGVLNMYEAREYIINSRIDALQHNVLDTSNLSHVDSLVERCDVCNVEISAYDWILKCPQNVCDYHIVCCKCANNHIIQYMQLMELLKEILELYLDDDCIHLVVSYTVAPIVQL